MKDNHTVISIVVKVSQRMQKDEVQLAYEGSGLAIFKTDFSLFFRSNVGNEIEGLLRQKEPHKPIFVYDSVHKPSLKKYTDLIDVLGNTNSSMLLCCPFFRQLKSGESLTTGQYMKYQTFSNLQFRPLFKK